MTNSNKIYTKCAEITLNEYGIIVITLLPTENEIDLDEVKKQYDAVLKLSGGEKCYVLADTTNASTQPTSEAQTFLLNIKNRAAEALVITSLPYRILAKFYLKKSKNNPVEIFSSKEKALNWLLKIKKKHYQL